MRRFRGNTRQIGGSFAAGAVNANTVHITNVTNVTHVLRHGCSNGGRAQRLTRPDRRLDARATRPSQLLVYLAQGRSSGELCDESVRTLGIAAHGVGSGVEGLACGVKKMATGLLAGTVGVLAALFGKDIC